MAEYGFEIQPRADPGAPAVDVVPYTLMEAAPSVQNKGMAFNRPAYAHVEYNLAEGDEILSDSGALLWLKPAKGTAMTVNTGCHGGCGASWCRANCAGEPCCQNKFGGSGVVAFGYDLPGDILPFLATCDPAGSWIVSKGMFLCGDANIVVSAKWKGCLTCLCSGEGGFLTHVSVGNGAQEGFFFAGGYGEIQKIDMEVGETLLVNTGLFFAAGAEIPMDIAMPGDCKSLCCSGEGLCMKFTAASKQSVWIQNRDQATFERLLNPMPEGGEGGGEGGDGGAGGA